MLTFSPYPFLSLPLSFYNLTYILLFSSHIKYFKDTSVKLKSFKIAMLRVSMLSLSIPPKPPFYIIGIPLNF